MTCPTARLPRALAALACALAVSGRPALLQAAQPSSKTERVFHIPADAVVVKDRIEPKDGEHTYWVRAGGHVVRQGGGGTYFVEEGGLVTLEGGYHVVFVRKGGTARFSGGSVYLFAEKGARASKGAPPTALKVYDRVTFAPHKAFTLRGTVTDARGKPAAGVKVHAFDLGKRHLGTVVSAPNGTFDFRPPREVAYLAADFAPRWARERAPGNYQDLDLREHGRLLKGWEVGLLQGGWASDAAVTIAHPGEGPLTVKELHKLPGSGVGSGRLTFSPDGRFLVVESDFGKAAVWDLTSGKELAPLPTGKGRLLAAAFSPDGATLGLIREDKVLQLLEPATGKKVPAPPGHKGGTTCLTWSPDGKTLTTGGEDGMVRLWGTDNKERRAFKAHEVGVSTLAFAPDGKTLATGGDVAFTEGMITFHVADLIRLWDVAAGREVRKFRGEREEFAFSPDGRLLAWGGMKRMIEGRANMVTETREDVVGLRSTVTGEEMLLRPRVGDRVTFSPDGRVLLTASQGGAVWFWEVATGELILKLPLPTRWAPGVTFGPGGQRVAAGQPDGTVRIWDLRWESLYPRPSTAPGPREFDRLWADLTGKSAAAYDSIRALAVGGDGAVAFLRERLKPASVRDLPLDRLIADLASDRFKAREAASRELKKLGAVAEPALRQALERGLPLEARQRIETVLAEVQKAPIPTEDLRPLRAVQALERIGSPEARRLLENLAGGWPAARQTLEARAALARLAPRGRTP